MAQRVGMFSTHLHRSMSLPFDDPTIPERSRVRPELQEPVLVVGRASAVFAVHAGDRCEEVWHERPLLPSRPTP